MRGLVVHHQTKIKEFPHKAVSKDTRIDHLNPIPCTATHCQNALVQNQRIHKNALNNALIHLMWHQNTANVETSVLTRGLRSAARLHSDATLIGFFGNHQHPSSTWLAQSRSMKKSKCNKPMTDKTGTANKKDIPGITTHDKDDWKPVSLYSVIM